jgi:hypothetical protein
MINLNGKDYKLYYLDTCALSNLVKDRSGFGSNLLNLVLLDGIIAVSPHSIWELKSSPTVYKAVIEVITSLPAVLLKSEDIIIKDEYQLLNGSITDINPTIIFLLPIPLKKNGMDILDMFNKHITEEKNVIFKQNRKETFKLLNSKPSNIYSRKELASKSKLDYSVKLVAYQLAAEDLLPELNYYSQIKKEFPVEEFPSLMSISYILHYKYLQTERKGSESDIQDICMSALYPYVDVVITERNQCAIIKQIQKRHNFFNNLKAISIPQVKSEKYED